MLIQDPLVTHDNALCVMRSTIKFLCEIYIPVLPLHKIVHKKGHYNAPTELRQNFQAPEIKCESELDFNGAC